MIFSDEKEEYEIGQMWDYFDDDNKWLSTHFVKNIEGRTVTTLCVASRIGPPSFGGGCIHPKLIGSDRKLCPNGKCRLV